MNKFELSQIVLNHLFENEKIRNELSIDLIDRLKRSEPKDENDTEFYEIQSNLYELILIEAIKNLNKTRSKN